MSIEAFVKGGAGRSNYEIMKERTAKLIASHDLEASARRTGLVCDGTYVYARLLDISCRLRISDGFTEYRESEGGEYREAEFSAAMILFDLLGYSEEGASPSGEYAVLQSFSKVHNSYSFAGSGMFADWEKLFDREFERLPVAFEALGGVPFGKGDASFRVPLFNGLCMVASFWRSDDEFPPSLSMSFDLNTLKYLHYETMWYAALFCMKRVAAHIPGAKF